MIFQKPYDFMNNSFDDFYKRLIDNISIIQHINVDEKIGFDNQECYIDTYTYYQGLSRWWYDNNRQKSYMFIEKAVHEIIDIYEDLSKQYPHRHITNKKSINKRKQHTIKKYRTDIQNELYKCMSGLTNLKYTYKTDIEYCNQIDHLMDKIKSITYQPLI